MCNKSLDNLSPATRRNYHHWCKKLLEFTRKTTIRNITQADIDEFFAWMVHPMGYPRLTVNQAKIAIKHYANANGIKFSIQTVSGRTQLSRPELINEVQARCMIDHLQSPYSDIAKLVFYQCVPPKMACAKFRSRLAGAIRPSDTTVHPSTFNLKLKEAADICDIFVSISGKSFQQSGIVAALRRGVDRDWLLEQAQITIKTLNRYLSF